MESKEIAISPEGLEIAQTYLSTMDIDKTCDMLQLSRHEVVSFLGKREVKAFIDTVFMDQGYNNRFLLAETMDNIIEAKLTEMQESEMASTKDISELLMMKHKMAMDILKMEIDLAKANSGPKTAVQINNDYGSNYGKLLEKLVASK